MKLQTRLRNIEKQLGVGGNVERRFLVVSGPAPETEVEKAVHKAEIEWLKQEAVRRDPTKTFHLIWLLDPLCNG